MDVESVRSGRSEKSDRSRRSKRVQMSSNTTGHQPFSDEQLKHANFLNQTPSSPREGSIPLGCTISSPTPGYVHPRGPLPPHTMYQWNSAAQPVNFLNYQPPGPYPSMNWSNQPLLSSSFSQQHALTGQPIPLLSQPQSNQSIPQSACYLPSGPPQAFLPLTNPASSSQMGNVNMTNQPAEPYRNEHFDPQARHRDDTAWVEEATAVTGATSETGLSGGDNFSRFGARFGLATSLGLQTGTAVQGISGATAALIRAEADDINIFTCSGIIGSLVSLLVILGALISPLLMLILPHLPPTVGWATESCKPNCESRLIGMSVKLILLSLASWVLSTPCRPFCMGGSAILPRIRLCRTLFLCLVFVVLFAFWLFYTVRIVQPKEPDYLSVVLFADNLMDTLLFLHYAGIALVEFRKVHHRYAIRVIRSPDGLSKTLKCSEMSIQRAAMEVLQFYMVEFTAYTANQSNGGSGKRGRRGQASNDVGSAKDGGTGGSKYKFYDVDAGNTVEKPGNSYTLNQPANNNGSNPSASSRLYEELEQEKRTRKRRMRLLVAVEEAFNHVRRLANETNGAVPGHTSMSVHLQGNGTVFKDNNIPDKTLDPYEAAQTVFPTLIRPLQKYLRATRQQARHPVDMVIDYLALSIAYGLSPMAFVQHFSPLTATPQQDAAAAASAIRSAKRDRKQQQRLTKHQQLAASDGADPSLLFPKHVQPGGQQVWSIVADRALSRSLTDGVIFQLRRGTEIALLCTVRQLPFFHLVEDALEPFEGGRFAVNSNNNAAV